MKKLLLFSLLFFTASSFAKELINYDQVKDAIVTGKQIHVYVDFSKCTSTDSKFTEHKFLSMYLPNEIAINDEKNYIAFALTHFTLNDPSNLGKAVYDFMRYTISNDNKINLIHQTVDATTYAVLSKSTFDCMFGAGAKIFD